jgi:hypothetical protein
MKIPIDFIPIRYSIMSFFSRIGQGIRKAFGAIGPVVKKFGDFVSRNHMGIASVAKAVGDASGNPTMKMLGDVALGASGAYTLHQNRVGQRSPNLPRADGIGRRRIVPPSD